MKWIIFFSFLLTNIELLYSFFFCKLFDQFLNGWIWFSKKKKFFLSNYAHWTHEFSRYKSFISRRYELPQITYFWTLKVSIILTTYIKLFDAMIIRIVTMKSEFSWESRKSTFFALVWHIINMIGCDMYFKFIGICICCCIRTTSYTVQHCSLKIASIALLFSTCSTFINTCSKATYDSVTICVQNESCKTAMLPTRWKLISNFFCSPLEEWSRTLLT